MAGATTWHGFATAILEAAGLKAPIAAIRSEDYAAQARRPKNSLLDNAKLRRAFGIALPDWREGLAAVMPSIH